MIGQQIKSGMIQQKFMGTWAGCGPKINDKAGSVGRRVKDENDESVVGVIATEAVHDPKDTYEKLTALAHHPRIAHP